jgi:hypothetical protein
VLARRLILLLVAALPGAAAVAVAAPAQAAVPLVAVPVSAHGWHPAGVSARRARSDLAQRLSRSAPRPTGVQVAGARRPAATLRDEAFVFGSAPAARRVVGAWAGRRAARAGVGQDGRTAVERGEASVIWREGARVGLLILRQRTGRSALAQQALEDARFADRYLRLRPSSDSWLRVLAGIGAHGQVSRSTALAAFSLAYGPLPGVRPPRGRHAAIESGTLAAWWALAYRPRLTAAQRAAVDRRLGLPVRRARPASLLGLGDRDFTANPLYQTIANEWQSAYEARLGRPLGLTMEVGTSPDVSAGADAMALNAQGEWGSGQPRSCQVALGPLGVTAPPDLQRLLVAHEVFHCFQWALLGSRTWHRPAPWIIEGTATWAADTVDPLPFVLADRLGHGTFGSITTYLKTPQTPLFTRAYDAVGFWGHLADVNGPLWARMAAIITAPGDEAAFAAAGGSDEENVLSSWGSSVFRIGSAPGFTMHSPVQPPSFDQLPPGSLEDIVSGPVAAPEYTTAQYVVRPAGTAPFIHVAIDGPARLLSGTTEYTDLSDAWFCVQGRDCTCPPDSAGDVPPTRPLTIPAYLGVTGRPVLGTAGVVEPATLDDFCHPRPKPPAPRSHGTPLGCRFECGSSNGDPHLHPFNADPYEFQAAGEFTLVRSTAGGLEIQTRQQPWQHSPSLSINTAIAMRVGTATVELDAGRQMRLAIDHRSRPALPAARLRLPGGGRLRTLAPLAADSGRAVEISWPDGSRARVWPISDFGLTILIAPGRSQTGKLTGLLGNLGGPANADFVGRDGHRYPADLISGGGALSSAARYGAFGESWRVRQSGSLFTYPHGRTTGSYTVRGFPRGDFELSDIPGQQRAQAEQLCRTAGVNDPAAFADCLVDVLGTGDPHFATTAFALQASAGRGTLVSAHPWTLLSSADDTATDVIPSLLSTAAGVTAAYRRDADGSVELSDLAPGIDGVALRGRSLPLTGWTSISDPVLFAGAGGQTALLAAGLHSDDSSDPLNGTSVLGRQSGGTLGTPTGLSTSIADGLGASAVLAADRSTPLWSSATGNQLVVHRGADEIDLSSLSPGIPVSSALGYDAAGELWLSWDSVGGGVSDGLYMLRLDPATGAPAPGASPQQAPASDAGNVQPRLALACAARCRVVYTDARDQSVGTLDSWAPGEPAPTVVAHGAGIRSASVAYAPDGRLWVTWVEGDNRLLAKLGDSSGAGGSAQLIPPPPGHDTPDQTTAIASGERLVLATEWSTLAADVNSVWSTVVDPR